MEALHFDKKSHLSEIESWAACWDMLLPSSEFLPKIGRIVPGICALFLYQTDSCFGLLESLISNPQSDLSYRSQAIDLCVSALEKDAQSLGYRFLMCSTHVSAVADRALSLGYRVEPHNYKMITKRLL